MKKQLTIILTLLLAVILCACTGSEAYQTGSISTQADPSESSSAQAENTDASDADRIRSSFDTATQHVESVIDTSGMTVYTDEEDSSYLTRTWFNENADQQADFSSEVVVDGITILIGKTTVKELSELGFEVMKSDEYLEPHIVTSVSVRKGRKELVLSLEENTTDQPIAIDDCRVFGFTGTYAEFVLPFRYMGLGEESTLQDAVDLLGVPNDSIQVSSDSTGSQINISYQNETANAGWNHWESLSFSFVYPEDSDNPHLWNVTLTHMDYQPDEEEPESAE